MRRYPEPSSSSPPREAFAGLVERVTFHNADNGFCVLRAKARGHRDLVTTVGHAASISAGESITASGEWVNDRIHGQQFRAQFLRVSIGAYTRRCSGTSVRSRMPRLSSHGTVSMPGIGGVRARVPVWMTMVWPWILVPSTTTVLASTKLAVPG